MYFEHNLFTVSLRLLWKIYFCKNYLVFKLVKNDAEVSELR